MVGTLVEKQLDRIRLAHFCHRLDGPTPVTISLFVAVVAPVGVDCRRPAAVSRSG
jgi:hypothetical protein